MFMRSELAGILEPGYISPFTLHENFDGLARHLSAPEAQALFDIHHYLKDDLLVKVDRATMQYSLETRVPLLDYRIVEFALNLSHDLKYRNGTMKYLLKQVLYDFLPAELFARPKWGFSIPLSRWLSGELKYLQHEFLSDDIIKKHGMVRVSAVHELKRLYPVPSLFSPPVPTIRSLTACVPAPKKLSVLAPRSTASPEDTSKMRPVPLPALTEALAARVTLPW